MEGKKGLLRKFFRLMAIPRVPRASSQLRKNTSGTAWVTLRMLHLYMTRHSHLYNDVIMQRETLTLHANKLTNLRVTLQVPAVVGAI